MISRFGRLLAILDIYDAMAGDRVFAKRRSPFDVFAILYDDILNGKLDTEYGVFFLKNLCHSLNGSWVQLSNGEQGRIVYIDESRVTSLPVVQTASGEFIDLNTERGVKSNPFDGQRGRLKLLTACERLSEQKRMRYGRKYGRVQWRLPLYPFGSAV